MCRGQLRRRVYILQSLFKVPPFAIDRAEKRVPVNGAALNSGSRRDAHRLFLVFRRGVVKTNGSKRCCAKRVVACALKRIERNRSENWQGSLNLSERLVVICHITIKLNECAREIQKSDGVACLLRELDAFTCRGNRPRMLILPVLDTRLEI